MKNKSKTFWFLFSVILFKIAMLLFLLINSSYDNNMLISERFLTNDASHFLNPVDNLIINGSYEFTENSGIPYVQRLPGYMFPYIFFRFLFSSSVSLYFVITYQIIISLFSSILLFRLVKKITRQLNIAFFIFIIYNLFSFLLPWELWIYPESLSVSYYVITLYFLYRFLFEKKSIKYLIYSGLFITQVFFLRGFLFMLIFSSALLLMVNFKFKKISIKYFLLFITPFIFFESIWISRNYIATKKFIPLTSIFNLTDKNVIKIDSTYQFNSTIKPSVLKLRKFISLWGGSNIKFYPNSEMSYFFNDNPNFDKIFPKWIFSRGVKKDTLKKLKLLTSKSYDENLALEKRIEIEKQLFNTIDNAHKNFFYSSILDFFLVKFSRAKNLIFHNVVGNWPVGSFSNNNIILKAYKLIILFVYFFLFVVSFIFFPLILFKIKNISHFYFLIFLFSNSIVVIFVFTFLIDAAEFKYTATIFVNSCILFSYFILHLKSKIRYKLKS